MSIKNGVLVKHYCLIKYLTEQLMVARPSNASDSAPGPICVHFKALPTWKLMYLNIIMHKKKL